MHDLRRKCALLRITAPPCHLRSSNTTQTMPAGRWYGWFFYFGVPQLDLAHKWRALLRSTTTTVLARCSIFSGVLSHGFQLCHIIKYRDEIINEITFLSE
jgi:hypothetical protein